jgi:hypothetical protein
MYTPFLTRSPHRSLAFRSAPLVALLLALPFPAGAQNLIHESNRRTRKRSAASASPYRPQGT